MSQSEKPFFGELLQQFRTRKRLNQTQLAKQIGVSRETVSLWERGYYKPETDTILYELVRVLSLTEQERDQLFEAYTVTASAVSFHNPPLERNPYFTGRSPQLTDLHTLLMTGKQVALTQAISGLGGIGKTQLALEYAYYYQKSYHDIFWVTADTYDALMTSYIRLAAILHLPEYEEQDQGKVKVAVQQWLSRHKGWLLILDDIEDLSLVHEFVPVDRQGAVLLTTRRQVTEPVAQALELGPLPENDAILFLLKRTKILSFDMSLENVSAHDIAMARTITQVLGNLPLAVDQAGAYVLETGCSFANYLDLFQKHQAELLRRRVGEGIPTDHPESVTTTFTLNFQQVQQRSEIAGEMLRVCAFLAPEDIGEEIFVQGASELGSLLQPIGTDDLLLNQAIEVLRTFSLIQRNPREKTLSVHRLIQAVLRDEMSKQAYQQWAKRTVHAVENTLPEVEHQTRGRYERCLPHALHTVQFIDELHLTTRATARLLYQIGKYLHENARYVEAEPLYKRALRISERISGPGHPDVAYPLDGLANLYQGQSRYDKAEPLYKRALRIRERSLGPNHPEVASLLNNLATLYQEQSKYIKAELFYRRALHISERSFGPDHPQVASLLNNLAFRYYVQGRYEQAEPLYQRALAIREQALGPEHPDVSYSLNGLANLYQGQGKYDKAEPLYQRAWHIWEQALGPEHPQVASLLNSLATLYKGQGKYDKAEPLYQRALNALEQAFGPSHPAVAYPLTNIASLYKDQGKYAEAEPFFQRALNILEQACGPAHPLTREATKRYASMLRTMGRADEAKHLEAKNRITHRMSTRSI